MHCFILLFVDLALISISTLAAIALCRPDASVPSFAAAGIYLAATLATSVPVLLVFRLNRTVWRFTSLGDCVHVAVVAVVIASLSAAFAFLFDRVDCIPGNLPVMQGMLVLYALGGARIAMRIRYDARWRARRAEASAKRDRENVLIVGLSPLADLFLSCVARNLDGRMEIVGLLSAAGRHHGRLLRSRKILGPPESVHDVLHDLGVHGIFVDRLVIATSASDLSEDAQAALADLTRSGKIRVEYLAPHYGLGDHSGAAKEKKPDAADDDLVVHLNAYLRWKRLLDAAVALVCLVGFLPVMILVGIVVLLDSGGPVIFWQQRPGAGGRPIKVLKFRTMGPARDAAGRALSDAERVSEVGRLLRRLRLDELPQILNVLSGDMSFVGPRPLLPVDQPSAPAARLQFRPGLTGWAQIKGGRHISSEDKAALDLWYIKNASFRLDVMILAHTVRMVLFGERVDQNAIHEAWQAVRRDTGKDLSGSVPEPNSI